jgi:SAM-dependent MidA family methyltransferase
VDVHSILFEKIKSEKWVTMEHFMEVALYDPDCGYYMKQEKKIGREGDFYTSSSVSDIFGSVWAKIFVKTITEHRLDPIIVEFGAGNGRFAQQVIKEWGKQHREGDFTYVVVEKSPYHRQLLKKELGIGQVKIIESLNELKNVFPSFKGIIFANEVLDAFPIRIFQYENKWLEKVVISEPYSKKFAFELIPLADQELENELIHYFQVRGSGYPIEVSFQMKNWLQNIYEWIEEGSVLFFVDYGYKNGQWKRQDLKEGSIRGYYRHQLMNDPLLHPGRMDITYHVDWDFVIRCGNEENVDTISLSDQGDFLLKEGLLDYLTNTSQADPFSEEHRRNRAIRSFLLDSSLSRGFQIIQQKKRSSN